jgi:hypothetical protein
MALEHRSKGDDEPAKDVRLAGVILSNQNRHLGQLHSKGIPDAAEVLYRNRLEFHRSSAEESAQ